MGNKNKEMVNISWDQFRIKNPNMRVAFEELCYFLFCRRFELAEGIRTDFNQVGLETEPIRHIDGKYYGFQSKFFDEKLAYNQILSSIEKALKNYTNLNCIIIYINKEARTSCDGAQKIEEICKKNGVKVEWYLPANFKVALNQPNNLDLAEFYFGATNILSILNDSKSIRMTTIIQSKEYLELNLRRERDTITVTDYCKRVLESEKKLHLISGAAGTGKSVCLRKVAYIYGGFDQKTPREQVEKIQKVGALCIFINLNNTRIERLETIISNRMKGFGGNNKTINYIYLLDGIDEVPTDHITDTLLSIESLLEKDTTQKIIISSRQSSYNKYVLKQSFGEIVEYSIEDLNETHVKDYFFKKGDRHKICKLNVISSSNPNFFRQVNDVLTLSLLWSYIENIDGSTCLSDLMEISISGSINHIDHRKGLEVLNLPNPKERAIIEINKHVAFFLFENDKFNLTFEEIYQIIEKIYPRCDYASLNEIIRYVADSFFDTFEENESYTFSYRHRRFSEYFTVLKLEEKMNRDLNYLRTNNLIINYDLFESLFIPYLQKQALKRHDLALACQLGLFNVYLGNDQAWGVEKEFYIWSDEIIYAIAGLNNEIFEGIINDSSLPISKFFNKVPNKIKKSLLNKDERKSDDELKQYLKSYITLISLMHQYGKKEPLSVLLRDYEEIRKLVQENGFPLCIYNERGKGLLLENFIYIETIILGKSLDERIELTLQSSDIDNLFKEDASWRITFLKSLYHHIILYHENKCLNMVNQMNKDQFSVFISTLTDPECLMNVIENHEFIKKMKQKLQEEISGESLSSVICLAFKKFLEVPLTKAEEEIIEKYFNHLEMFSYSFFSQGRENTAAFILATFDSSSSKIDGEVRKYVNGYRNFLKLLNKSCSIEKFICESIKNISNNTTAAYYIRILLGKVLALIDEKQFNVKGAVDYLNDNIKGGGLLVVYRTMKVYNPARFKWLIGIADLYRLVNDKVYRDSSFESTSESLFILSFILSDHDKRLGYEMLLKGISHGVMRMHMRKDTIGDSILIDSLKILLESHWISTDELIKILKRILDIVNKMEIHHIDNDVHAKVIELLENHDFIALDFYYNQINDLDKCSDYIHYKYALTCLRRGKNIKLIEGCLDQISYRYDRYYQKIDHDCFCYRIKVYLNLAINDFYSLRDQQRAFKKACISMDKMVEAGWPRELDNEDYEIYVNLCNKYNHNLDCTKKEPVFYSSQRGSKEGDDIKEVVHLLKSKEDLDDFIKRISKQNCLQSLEVNELFIEKCLMIDGGIDRIINIFKKYYYPSSLHSINSHNFWLTVVAALKNSNSKSKMTEYLLESGGGHDGFSELIKIYAYLGNKDLCIRLFERLLASVEFLLC